MRRIHADWYLGTADAVFQNTQSVVAENPEHVLLLASDHIYKMNYHEMIAWHRQHQADVTLATIQVSPEEADRFGIVEIDAEHRVVGFEEKPEHGRPVRSIFNPSMVSASMGVYLFNTETMLSALKEDAEDPDSSHDFGRDVIPRWIRQARVVAYDFTDLNDKSVKYWRDVGTLEAYYDANMDLVSVIPEFNLYDTALADPHPPAPAAAGQVRLRAGRPAHGGGHRFHRFGRLHRLGGPGGALGALAGRADQQLLRGGKLDSDARG